MTMSTETIPKTSPSHSALIGVFHDRLQAERAVRDLEAVGFDKRRIGFVIRGSDVAQGGMITDTIGAKDGSGAIAGAVTGGLAGGILAAAVTAVLPGVGPVLAAGVFAMFVGYAGAGAAIGGILGALIGLGVSEEEARYYEKHFHEGRAIVAVSKGAQMQLAGEILARNGADHLQNLCNSPIDTGGALSLP
jgi:hypothetical protein